MQKGMGRLGVLVGTVVYITMGLSGLMVYAFDVEFFSFVTLGILVQVLLALPMVAGLLGKPIFPVLDCAKFLLAVVVALAVSGFLGVPRGSSNYNPTVDGYKAEIEKIQANDLNQREWAELQVDLAEAEDDDDKKKIREEIKAVNDDISKEDKKTAEREISVLKAKGALASLEDRARRSAIVAAERRSGLMILSAFLIFAGAFLMHRDGE